MQVITYPPLKGAQSVALAHLKAGNAICYPTDTLYGIGGDAKNPGVVKKILEIKKKEGQAPFSVIFSGWKMAGEYVKASPALVDELEKLTPGPFTFLLPLSKSLPVTPGPLLGCRIPDHEFCISLSKAFGKPIISTSANLHGERDASCIEEMDERIMGRMDLIVDGGACKYKEGSTIIDVGGRKIVRKGALCAKAEQWLEKLKI